MSSSENKNETISTEMIYLQKMLFVFNAVLSGWTVKMVDNDKFEFKKDRKNQEVNLDNYLRTFIVENLSVDNISNVKDVSSKSSTK